LTTHCHDAHPCTASQEDFQHTTLSNGVHASFFCMCMMLAISSDHKLYLLSSFWKFYARCRIHSLCSTPGNTISTALSKPLQASVCIAKPGGVPIMLRNHCRNQTQLSLDFASTTPNATRNS
jgi:hypothetical protein